MLSKNSLGSSSDGQGFSSGYTLVELMITVAILAILATVAIPMYQNYINRAKQADAIISLKAAQMAQEQMFSERNKYCSTIDSLPGFGGDGNVNNRYQKGEYEISVINAHDGTNPGFIIAATRVVGGNTDRWTISETNENPICDTTVSGIKGYSLFRWVFGQ
ncbi:MAG: prepilin-type N-terminal cleavage/methylation domain-containing protein [Deltaproteobacteria bacterium]|nr:prepilin-type N-terminal cleavage/methylation domain-containing protein [Candidatus Anaeroferrophillacea bacterium]